MMLFKSIAFILAASKASAGLLRGDTGFFDNLNDLVGTQQQEEPTRPPVASEPPVEEEPPQDGDLSMPPVASPVGFSPVSSPVSSPVASPVASPVGRSPVGTGEPVSSPVSSPVFFLPSDDDFLVDPMPDRPMPGMPVMPVPEEDPTGTFLLTISKDAQLQPIIDDFLAKNPNATLKETYPFGFSVANVTESQIKMFSNSCSNLVLDIFKLFHASSGGGAVGEEGNGCIAAAPSGTITMKVVYDTFAYETHFSLWHLNSTNWTSLHDYPPPTTFPLDKQTATVKLEDGLYSFDIVDLAHDGMAAHDPDGWYTAGHFTITETDSGKEIYKGAEFGSYLSVEFEITNGTASLLNVKNLHTNLMGV